HGHTIKAGRTKKAQHADGPGMARNIDIALKQADGKAERLAQEARQDESGTHRTRCIPHRARAPVSVRFSVQRKQDASSTIQLNNSPKEIPAALAISGTSEVGVIPGWVLISSQITSPPSEKRSSKRKSDRLTPRHPIARCAVRAIVCIFW